ncbi:MAG: short-chain dehydrogenase [Phenylobacterium sp.]|nr:short-chain dehydrogenase [Phenylobacterium sp.]
MDFGIRGRVAFICGGSRGIARDVAEMLAAEGCKVAVVARNQGPLDEVVQAIRAKGGEAMGVSADLSTREGVRGAVAAVAAKFGDPDIAISNLPGNIAGNFDDVTDDDFLHIFNLYAMHVVHVAREVIPGMKAKGWGRFVAVGSGVAKEQEGKLRHILANMTRPAAVGFAKSLSDEVACHGITVNTVAPGWIATQNMYDYLEQKVGVPPDKVNAFLGDSVPARRTGRPEEIASLITYLCSDLAGYITGQWIAVDGGKARSVV